MLEPLVETPIARPQGNHNAGASLLSATALTLFTGVMFAKGEFGDQNVVGADFFAGMRMIKTRNRKQYPPARMSSPHQIDWPPAKKNCKERERDTRANLSGYASRIL